VEPAVTALATFAWVLGVAVAAPAVFGRGVLLAAVGGGIAPAVAWGHGYLLGQCLLAPVTLLQARLDWPVHGAIAPLVAAALGVALARRAARAVASPSPGGMTWTLGVAIALFVERCLAAAADPIRVSDEAMNWASKAKVLFAGPWAGIGEPLAHFVSHADYPLLDPLVQMQAFAAAGRVLHWENRAPVQAFGVALLLLVGAALAGRARPAVACATLLALLGTRLPGYGCTAYADVMLAACAFAAFDALARARDGAGRGWWPVACVLLAGAVATKQEGLLVAGAALAPFAAERALAGPRRAVAGWRRAAWMAVPALAAAGQARFVAAYGLANDMLDAPGRAGLAARIVAQAGTHGPKVLAHHLELLLDGAATGWLPLGLFVAAPVALVLRGRDVFAGVGAHACCACALALAAYMAVFVGTVHDVVWHLAVAADRTALHVLPIAALGLAAVAAPRAAVTRGP
jgi:hypothetical protein